MTYLGQPVFEWAIDWANPVNGSWAYDLNEIQIGFGPELIDPTQDHVVHGWQFQADFHETQITAIDAFLDALKGKSNPFWLPGPMGEFIILEPVSDGNSSSSSSSQGGTSFLISEQGATTGWTLKPDVYLWFYKAGQTPQQAKIFSVSSNGTTETVTLTTELDTPIDSTWGVYPLVLVRLADDSEAVTVRAEGWQTRTFRVVELPNDYALLGEAEPADASEPVYLYRFTAQLPDGDVVWRFTSHPEDVSISDDAKQSSSSSSDSDSLSSSTSQSSSKSSGDNSSSSTTSTSSANSSSSESSKSSSSSQSPATTSSESSSSENSQWLTEWLAVGISHTRVTHSAKLGGTVTVTGDVDTIEPLRLCLPQRMFGELKLEILRTDTRFVEPTSQFSGVVRKPQLRGRQMSVTVEEFGDAMEVKLPPFFIQRDCNYRVYDPNTCRAVKADFDVTVTITSAAGRVVQLSGAGLAGIAENYFAHGWIEIGTGLTRRTLFVLSSREASGTTCEVVVSSPPGIDLPASGTAVPGCDRLRATCLAKFDNIVNFGGHETPKENLTLIAIRSNTSTRGKK